MLIYRKEVLAFLMLVFVLGCKPDETSMVTLNRTLEIPIQDSTINGEPFVLLPDSVINIDSVVFSYPSSVLITGTFYVRIDLKLYNTIRFDSITKIGCVNTTRNTTPWQVSDSVYQEFYNFNNAIVVPQNSKNQRYYFFIETKKQGRILGEPFIT